jgi:hypothetical protein
VQTRKEKGKTMTSKRLIGLAAAAAAVLILPLHAAAYGITLTYSVSPTTAGAWSTVTVDNTADPSRTLSSSKLTLDPAEVICHHGDATCSPADNTQVGTATATTFWLSNFCVSSSTQNFNVFWINPDGGYSPSDGTVVSEVQIKSSSSLFNVTFDAYVVQLTVGGGYYIQVPSYPNLACHNASYPAVQIHQVLGKVGTTTYNLHKNPSSVGTWTDTISLHYTSGSDDSASTTWSTT